MSQSTLTEPSTVTRPPAPSEPRPRAERGMRGWLIAIAVFCVVVAIGGLGVGTVVTAMNRAEYGEIPAVTDLGMPEELSVDASIGDISVRPDPEATSISLALVAPSDTNGVPSAGDGEDTVRAKVDVAETTSGTTVTVSQPWGGGPVPMFDEPLRDIVLTIPASSTADLDLTLSSDVGDVSVEDVALSELKVTSSVGDVDLRSVRVPGHLDASADVGDLTLDLSPDDALEQGPVDLRTSSGNIEVGVPSGLVFRVDARSEVGSVETDPDVIDSTGPRLTARSDVGDVTIGR
jgi:hypothetical protein